MNPLWTARAIASATGGTASADFTVQGVAFDSREVRQGDLFIAMKGEATDGHKFIDKAIAAGAAGIRSEEHTSELQSLMRISYAVFCLKKKNRKRQSKTLIQNSKYTN